MIECVICGVTDPEEGLSGPGNHGIEGDVCELCFRVAPMTDDFGKEHHSGRWVPVPPAHLGDDLDEWVETCPHDRVELLAHDREARHYIWEWIPFESEERHG